MTTKSRARKNTTSDSLTLQLLLGSIGELPSNHKDHIAEASAAQIWHSVVKHARNNIVITDRDGTICYINNTLTGVDPALVLGTSIYDYIQAENHTKARETLDQVFRTGETGIYELQGGPLAQESWYETQVGPVIWDEQVIGATLVTRDVTERKAAERALEESELKYRTLVDTSPIAITYYGLDDTILLVNRAGARNLGGTTEEFVGKTIQEVLPEMADEVMRRNLEVIESGEEMQCEDWLDLPWGRRLFFSTITPVRGATGKIEGTQILSQDVTERKAAEQALRDLSRKIVDVQEQERRHIARELHDQVGQILTAVKLFLQMVFEEPNVNKEKNINEIQNLINETMRLVGDMSLDLRPSMLDDLGLLPALLWHFDRYTARTGVNVKFRHRGLRNRLPNAIETAIYRIVQEALTNVARHAQTCAVSVRVFVRRESVTIQVHDDGVGFDSATGDAEFGSSGLTGMRERAVALGGEMTVNSRLGQGTDLVARIPIGSSG